MPATSEDATPSSAMEGSAADARGPATSPVGSLLEVVVIVVVALGLALGIQGFLIKPYQIPSGSMVPTLNVGQRVLVNRLGERFGSPHIGDVVVFHPPAAATGDQTGVSGEDSECGAAQPPGAACAMPVSRRSRENFVKRIVAGPGDTVAIANGHVIRNGEPQREPFVRERCSTGAPADFTTPIRIPAGHWFMMGDNRQCSEDSRFWGPVPESWIIGGAVATYWPPKRVGVL